METNIFPFELLGNVNYADWSVKMKNHLLDQGLWNIVETSSKPPKPDDDVVEFEAWRKRNDTTLQAIQSSCEMNILSLISNICSAKIAWETLAKMFMESNGPEKLMQTEDDDSIINEGNFSSSDNAGQESEDDYVALLMAVRSGDWETTKAFLELHPQALIASILIMGGTVLHAAVEAKHEHIVVELVNMISEHHLETMKDSSGHTALHKIAIGGNQGMAECLIRKNRRLVSFRNDVGRLPLSSAMSYGHKELARYLYSQTPFEDLEPEPGYNGASLLIDSIYNRDLDMALLLMERCPRLAFALDQRYISPLEALAVSTDAFESENRLVFWKRWIYNHCIHISLDRVADQFRLNIQNYQEKTIGSGMHYDDRISSTARAADQFHLNIQNNQENIIESVRADTLWRQLISSLSNLLGFKRLYEMKLVHLQFQELLYRMCEAIPANTSSENVSEIIAPAIFRAISKGNFEFVYQIVKANSSLLSITDAIERRGIFHWVVLHRQHKIFSLLYNLRSGKNFVLNGVDYSNNTILHLVGMLREDTPIDHIRGAALQMQREAVQWFKEVERICPPSFKEYLNNDGLTPRQLFTRDHQNLIKEGEKWMKGIATSCTVVYGLIITIMLATFTIPRGNHQDTSLFILFIVTNSMSLFSSSTAAFMFLVTFTSSYAEENFLISLPKGIIIGLFNLFYSIATMMIAFFAALSLMLSEKYLIVIPIIGLLGVPIILFVLMQCCVLVDMLVLSYGSAIFDRKMKPWF